MFLLRLTCKTGRHRSPTVALVAQAVLSAWGKSVDVFPVALVKDWRQEVFRMERFIT